MWLLKRLANLGASRGDLLDVYNKQIRCITEYSAPVWNSALTKEDIANIERVQRSALHIIMGDQYLSYEHALKSCGLSRLAERREKICKKFALRATKHSKFKSWFNPETRTNNRVQRPCYRPVVFKTERFKNSPISYMTKLLNNLQ